MKVWQFRDTAEQRKKGAMMEGRKYPETVYQFRLDGQRFLPITLRASTQLCFSSGSSRPPRPFGGHVAQTGMWMFRNYIDPPPSDLASRIVEGVMA